MKTQIHIKMRQGGGGGDFEPVDFFFWYLTAHQERFYKAKLIVFEFLVKS